MPIIHVIHALQADLSGILQIKVLAKIMRSIYRCNSY